MPSRRRNPWDHQEWHALHREASLVSQLIGVGATALGRASYGNGLGEYYTAFFSLSIGIERLAKLILVADFALDNQGMLPDQNVIKRFGHELEKLVNHADKIATQRNLKIPYKKPTDPISWAALECLNSFASASKGRYANFEAIGNPNFDVTQEPVRKWWRQVVEPILSKHYRDTSHEQRVKAEAKVLDALIGETSFVSFTAEDGDQLSEIDTASERSGQTKWAQKYGRFYTLSVVRWLSGIFCELARKAADSKGMDMLYGHWELFSAYRLPDRFLLTRKKWP